VDRVSYWGRTAHPNGRIRDYNIYVTDDPDSLGTAVASGTFLDDVIQQDVVFTAAAGRYLAIKGTTTYSGNNTGSSEVTIYGARALAVAAAMLRN
jgi:hypothetical protein